MTQLAKRGEYRTKRRERIRKTIKEEDVQEGRNILQRPSGSEIKEKKIPNKRGDELVVGGPGRRGR